MSEVAYTELPDDLNLAPQFEKIVAPDGPPPVKMMASKGIVPGATPADLLHVLFALTFDADANIADGARKALVETPVNILTGAINDSTHGGVIDALARVHVQDEHVIEHLTLRKKIHDRTLMFVAAECPHLKVVEIVAKNQERLLECPEILDGLKANSVSPKSLVDVTTAFLQMAGVLPMGAEGRSQGLPERIDQHMIDALLEDEEEFDNVLIQDTDNLAGEEPSEEVRLRISEMSVPQKIKLAFTCNMETRMTLLRDTNRMVVSAVLKSGRVSEAEALQLTKARTIDSEILKFIAGNRDFRKRYEIKLNLASNPKTPQGIALRLLAELRPSDLKGLAKNRNVPGAVMAAAKRLLEAKTGARRKR